MDYFIPSNDRIIRRPPESCTEIVCKDGKDGKEGPYLVECLNVRGPFGSAETPFVWS